MASRPFQPITCRSWSVISGEMPFFTPQSMKSPDGAGSEETSDGLDLSHIKGQEHAKRALEVAAAGGHNLLMSGPPGAGKTLLARAMPSILPRMTSQESLEVTKIYSVGGPVAPG